MARPGFLDRLTGEHAGERDELARVLRNVEAVLNTQSGYGSFVHGFGLGDYTALRGTRDLVEALTAELQHEVERHEPRLSNVEVKLTPSPKHVPRPSDTAVELKGRDPGLWLRFSMTAKLHGKPLELDLFFDTVSSRVRVEKKE